MNYPVFVYGTLRNGFGNYERILAGRTEKETPALSDGAIYPVSNHGGFPCLVDEEGTVVGELMYIKPELYEETLKRLDQLEGYRVKYPMESMYIRRLRWVVANGEEVKAYVYVWNSAIRTPKIESGCWKTFEMMKLMESKGVQ